MKSTSSVRIERRKLLRAALGAGAMMPTALMARDTVVAIREAGLAAQNFGALFNGRSDDSAALQRGIDEAARTGRALVLPSGTSRLDSPLDLKGRNVSLIGDPTGHTILQASRRMRCILDAEDLREVIDSPLYLYGLALDGGGTTETGLLCRFRHNSFFDTLTVRGCRTGIEERDTWLGRRINCRTRATDTGWRLGGSNHSSLWIGCTFTDAREAHLDIASDGTANDGNDALLFQGCDIEFGAGHGIQIASGATATFDTCYIGEGIGGDVLRSAGHVVLRGGAFFVGYAPDRSGIVALGGNVDVTNMAIRGQRYGSLSRLAQAELSSGNPGGRVTFSRVSMQLEIGGDPVMRGDVLGSLSMRVFAPLNGRNWRSTSDQADIADTSLRDERGVRCTGVTGPTPLIGLAAPLRDKEEARRGDVVYMVIVYSATAPVELKFTSGPMSRAPWRIVGTLPATDGVSTYVKADFPADFASFEFVELIMRAKVGDELVLHHATVSDASILEPKPLGNLGRAR